MSRSASSWIDLGARFVGRSLGVACFASAVHASAETKLELGVRTGYAVPLGKLYGTGAEELSSNEVSKGQVPLWFDIGARMGAHVFVGGYLQYGVALLSEELSDFCDGLERAYGAEGGGASCNVHDLRLGAELHYHFGGLGAPLDPWLGGGFGYEWLSAGIFVHRGGDAGDAGTTLHGFEYLNLQTGFDFPVSKLMTVGPFVAFTLGSYGTVTRTCDGSLCNDGGSSESVRDRTLHQWLFFGVRAEFVP